MTDLPSIPSSPEPTGSDPVSVWRNQPTMAFHLSPTAVADAEHKYARLRSGVAIKSTFMLLGILAALYKAATVDATLLRLAALAFVAAYAQVLYNLQRTRRGDADAEAAIRMGAGLAAPSLVHYRAALVRERDRLTGLRLWLPFAAGIPAGLIIMLNLAHTHPLLERYLWLEVTLFLTAMPLAALYGLRQGRHFQSRLDHLDAFARE